MTSSIIFITDESMVLLLTRIKGKRGLMRKLSEGAGINGREFKIENFMKMPAYRFVRLENYLKELDPVYYKSIHKEIEYIQEKYSL